MKVLLIGGTGAIGNKVLEQLLIEPKVKVVTAPTRKPLPEADKLLNPVVDLERVIVDKSNSLLNEEYGIVICTLGTTIKKARSKKRFFEVEHDLVTALAKHVYNSGCQHFIYCSSIGATAISKNYYLQTKGKIEESLEAIGFQQLTIIQPSLLAQADRIEFRFAEKVGECLLQLIRPLLPNNYKPIRVETVALAIAEYIQSNHSGIIRLQPEQIRFAAANRLRD